MQDPTNIKKQIEASIPSLFKNVNELAEAAGVNQPNLSGFLKGRRKSMKVETAWKIWEAMKNRSSLREMQSGKAVQAEDDEELQTVYIYQKAAAGNAIALSDIDPLCEFKLPFKYIAKFDFAVLVDGHSMEPTIKHESIIGAKQDFDFIANELYVAQIPYEGLVVKRVAVNRENQSFIFKSDNPNKEYYPDMVLNMNECEKFLLGRVVWFMHKY
jgi:phage repressor protein C with HTH and peptisase S24 domain